MQEDQSASWGAGWMRYKRPEWVLVSCGELGVSICCFCHQTIVNNKNWHSKAKAVGVHPMLAARVPTRQRPTQRDCALLP
jgi:hypothetical protein